jgi:hypothetical protein
MSYGKELLDKLKSNKSKSNSEIIDEQTRGTYTGSAIGLLVGLYIGYSRNWSLLMSAGVGALVGGLVTKAFIKKKDDK